MRDATCTTPKGQRMNSDLTMEVIDAKRQLKAEGADLSDSSFQDVNLSGTHFRNVTFAGANFEDVKLSGTHFRNMTFAGAKFEDVNLSGWSLHNVNLSGWSLHNVNLANLRIQDADLRNASIDDSLTAGMTINGIPLADLLAAYRALHSITE